jgi:ABC-type microcin C transport system duplicated ATPase subunit YejF
VEKKILAEKEQDYHQARKKLFNEGNNKNWILVISKRVVLLLLSTLKILWTLQENWFEERTFEKKVVEELKFTLTCDLFLQS